MGFLRLPRISKNKKRVVAVDLGKMYKNDEPPCDSSIRTCDTNDASSDDKLHHPASALHLRERLPLDAERDALDVVQRRLSDRRRRRRSSGESSQGSSSVASRVSFVDEELGLTPRHVVTQVHYRPRTMRNERAGLYYSGKDFSLFEKEELFENIQELIRRMESGPADPALETEVRDLTMRMQRLR